jgi:hypothetical protein
MKPTTPDPSAPFYTNLENQSDPLFMNRPPLFPRVTARLALLAFAASIAPSAMSQTLPPNVVSQFQNLVGPRVEALTVLGGDYGLSGAKYKTTGGGNSDTHIDVSKFGGSGDVGDPMPLGDLGVGWQPRLQGSMGTLNAEKKFTDGTLNGDRNKYETFAIQFGGGARFWFNDQLSIAPTFMGMYGHTRNSYEAESPFGQRYAPQAGQMGLINWNIDTWTIRPALNAQYVFVFGRTLLTLASDFTYFHTESFNSSSSVYSVNGDSETWRNLIDVDVPTGVQLFGHELRTGGFFARTEFFNDIEQGLNTDHMYEVHGRVVLDFLNQLWKVQWIGLGASYLWGSNFEGYSIGADVAFRF